MIVIKIEKIKHIRIQNNKIIKMTSALWYAEASGALARETGYSGSSSEYLPCFVSGSVVHGERSQVLTVPDDAPVYTLELVGYGPQKKGVMCDAPKGHPSYNKTFHVINRNSDGEYMMHRIEPYR